MAAPLLPRMYDEDENTDWENKAHKILQEELGSKTYTILTNAQYKVSSPVYDRQVNWLWCTEKMNL